MPLGSRMALVLYLDAHAGVDVAEHQRVCVSTVRLPRPRHELRKRIHLLAAADEMPGVQVHEQRAKI